MITTHFVPSSQPGEYVVEIHEGSTRYCIGRVVRFGTVRSGGYDWCALGVGTSRWTRYMRTRAEAVEQMREIRAMHATAAAGESRPGPSRH